MSAINITPATTVAIKIEPGLGLPISLSLVTVAPIQIEGTPGIPGPPGRNADDLPEMPDLALIFEGALI